MIHPAAERARQAISARHFQEAKAILSSSLDLEPDDSDLLCEWAICLCYDCRETTAAESYVRAREGHRATFLYDTLSTHFFCSVQLDPSDNAAKAWANKFPLLCDSLPGTKLTACLIVKNEEANLPACLESLRGIVDEIVVVDTGSADATVQVAKRFGVTLGKFEWIADFAAARNASLDLATGNWILWIDADERLTLDSFKSIRRALTRPHFGGFDIEIVNFTEDGDGGGHYVHFPTRLFLNRPTIRFEGRIHEQISPSLARLSLPCARLEGAQILHEGYRPSEMVSKGKAERTVKMLQKEVLDTPEDPFQWFNLANALVVAGRNAEAEYSARTCTRLMPARSEYGPVCYQILSTALANLGRLDDALEACRLAEAGGYGGIICDFEKSSILLRTGRLVEALEAADKCVAAKWPAGSTGDHGIFTHKRFVLRCQILAMLGRFAEADESINIALAYDRHAPTTILAKAVTQEGLGKLQSAESYYQTAIAEPSLHLAAGKGLARVHLALGRAKEAAAEFRSVWLETPEDHESWIGWCHACEGCNDSAGLVEAYEAYAERGEPTVEILVDWGRALENAGRFEQALECFAEAIKRDPRNANAYFNCGDLLYRAGAFADAAHVYESGLRQAPDNAEGWFVLGNSLAQMGLEGGAVTSYQQALSLQPGHVGAAHNLTALTEAA